MTHVAALLAAAAVIAGIASARPAQSAQVGAEAPLFTADASSGKVALADFRGKKNILLAFYFKDFTGG